LFLMEDFFVFSFSNHGELSANIFNILKKIVFGGGVHFVSLFPLIFWWDV